MSRPVLRSLAKLNLYLLVGGVALLMILPFYWMIATAFMPASDIIAFPPQVDPDPADAGAFRGRLRQGPLADVLLVE